MRAAKYLGPFVYLLSIPLLYATAVAAPFLAPIGILASLVVATQMKRDVANNASSDAFRLLPIVYIPLQLTVTLWGAHEASRADALGFASLAVSIGVCTGVFGVLAAHEMVHSRESWHRLLGALMLTGMTYRHFRIAHIYGHHRHAATERDASTARLGESFYAFLPRTLWQQLAESYGFEQHRLRCGKRFDVRNRVIQDVALMILVYGGLTLLWGWRSALFLAVESVVGIVVLELFNYVAHYGLVRRVHDGQLEPFRDHHSWNSSGLGNFLIFNMGRHSHHHREPAISYEDLRRAPAPELPAGYAGSIVLALVPPLWHALMDQRARAFNLGFAGAQYADSAESVSTAP
ncbi:MAG TPA: alkane 1-monooxygenase [Rhizomicrobium sp.]|nr:alkane 1-monooxygenase [Rhizomicrobium sp.]